MLNQNLQKWGPRTHVLICFPHHNSFILWNLETNGQADLWSPFQILTIIPDEKVLAECSGDFLKEKKWKIYIFQEIEKNQLFEEASQEASRRELRAEGLTPKARLAGLQDQGHTAHLLVLIHLPSPNVRRAFCILKHFATESQTPCHLMKSHIVLIFCRTWD